MKELKVLVVFTGGTIGSAQRSGFLSPGGAEPRRLLLERFSAEKQSYYEERFRTKVSFETVCPYEILSENLNGRYLELLWQTVRQGAKRDYDGIIITTGTDSLAYSAAAMGYLFANVHIPIVMVSANYPLTDARSNGASNFEGALLLILEKKHKGVFCSYQNTEGHYMHFATRLLPQDNYSDRVLSVKDGFYAELRGGSDGSEWVLNESQKEKPSPNGRMISGEVSGEEEWNPLRCENMEDISVAFQKPYPGMQFLIPDSCHAILLDTYHSGTLPVKESGFGKFMREAQKRKIPVFVAGVPEGLTYETVAAYEEEGAYVCPPASPTAMYIKLWLLLANELDPVVYMQVPMGHDIL